MPKQISINFDLDGTLANLYARPTWLQELRAFDPTPYEVAKTMVNMSLLARHLNRLQTKGYKINIISWLSKESTPQYDQAVKIAKLKWLQKHLPSVKFDNIYIIPYGTPKSHLVGHNSSSILFDDEINNIIEWVNSGGYAYTPNVIFEILKNL